MPRSDTSIRVSNFLTLDDASPDTINPDSAAVLENFYKKRRVLQRRAGQSEVAVSPALTAVDLTDLEWCRINGTSHLIGVHQGDVRDFLGGATAPIASNGTDRLPTAGDVNGAFLDGKLYLGNGSDQNIRYTDQPLAVDLPGTTTEFLSLTDNAALGLYNINGSVNNDFTIAFWVWLDVITGSEKAIVSVFSDGSPDNSIFSVNYVPTGGEFRFEVRDGLGAAKVLPTVGLAAAAGAWHFVIARHDAAADRIYIQVNGGALLTSTAYTNGINSSCTADLRISGADNGASAVTVPLDGRVGPVGIWRTAEGGGGALSNALMTALYNAGRPMLYRELPWEFLTGMVAWYDNTETNGSRTNRHTTGSAYDLTAVGAGVGSALGPQTFKVTAQVMVPQAASTLTLVSSGTSGLPIGTYSYVVTHMSADGNPGEPTAAVSITIAAARTLSVQTIPAVTTGQDQLGRIVWRSDNGGPYAFLARILDTDTLYVDDNAPEPDLSRLLVVGNTRFPPCRYLIEHQDRMMGAHTLTSEGDKSTLHISNYREPWYSPVAPNLEDPSQGTRATISNKADDEITGLCSHGGLVGLFTSSEGYLLLGVDPNDFRLQRFSNHGCVAHRTIKSVRSQLIWLAPDGVYSWDGTLVNWISEPVDATITAMTAAQMAGASAHVWDDKYFLNWSAGCLYYDLQYGIWGSLTNNLWRKVTVSPQISSQRERVYAAREGTALVYELETGTTDAIPSSPTTITARWRSADWDMGLATREKRLSYVETRFKKSTGTATITMRREGGEVIQTLTHDISVVDNASDQVSKKLQSIVEAGRAELFSVEVSVPAALENPTAIEFQAVGLQWNWGS
jgi:Concanavalin A-like lectin/glucanases superfamily